MTHFVQSLGKLKLENLTLVTSSKWRKYDKIENEYFATLKTHYIDQFFVDYTRPEVIRFIDRFRETYSMEPTLDQFAFQGYDITFFFVNALLRYGNGFGEEVNQMQLPLLGTQFHFQKYSNLTYENSFTHLYKLDEDYQYTDIRQQEKKDDSPLENRQNRDKRKK